MRECVSGDAAHSRVFTMVRQARGFSRVLLHNIVNTRDACIATNITNLNMCIICFIKRVDKSTKNGYKPNQIFKNHSVKKVGRNLPFMTSLLARYQSVLRVYMRA